MERLDNYAIAICIYFMAGNVLDVNKTAFPEILDDLNAYFFGLQSKLSTSETELFNIEAYLSYYRISLGKEKQKELQELLTNYVDELEKDKLKSNDNILSWKNELKAFVKKVKASEYNLKSYNVAIEDMHVILYGIIRNLFILNCIEIGLYDDEVIVPFLTRDSSGDVVGKDVSKFYDSLQVSCNVNISSFMNKQNKKNATHSPYPTKEDWLYKYICEKTGGISSSIPMQFELIDVDRTKPNTYPNFQSFKQSYNRLNKRYEQKYGVKYFVKKVKNEDLFQITFAKNDKKNGLL